MPCPNCTCRDCAKDRAKPTDGWHLGKHDAHYLTRDGVTLAVVFSRPYGWEWWDFRLPGTVGVYNSKAAAQKAAEKATRVGPGFKGEGE